MLVLCKLRQSDFMQIVLEKFRESHNHCWLQTEAFASAFAVITAGNSSSIQGFSPAGYSTAAKHLVFTHISFVIGDFATIAHTTSAMFGNQMFGMVGYFLTLQCQTKDYILGKLQFPAGHHTVVEFSSLMFSEKGNQVSFPGLDGQIL